MLHITKFNIVNFSLENVQRERTNGVDRFALVHLSIAYYNTLFAVP